MNTSKHLSSFDSEFVRQIFLWLVSLVFKFSLLFDFLFSLFLYPIKQLHLPNFNALISIEKWWDETYLLRDSFEQIDVSQVTFDFEKQNQFDIDLSRWKDIFLPCCFLLRQFMENHFSSFLRWCYHQSERRIISLLMVLLGHGKYRESIRLKRWWMVRVKPWLVIEIGRCIPVNSIRHSMAYPMQIVRILKHWSIPRLENARMYFPRQSIALVGRRVQLSNGIIVVRSFESIQQSLGKWRWLCMHRVRIQLGQCISVELRVSLAFQSIWQWLIIFDRKRRRKNFHRWNVRFRKRGEEMQANKLVSNVNNILVLFFVRKASKIFR